MPHICQFGKGTAPNQTVFIAGIPYLAHTFTITCARPHLPSSRSRSFADLGLWLKFSKVYAQIILYGNRGHLCSTKTYFVSVCVSCSEL
jgi:hypothetical protein